MAHALPLPSSPKAEPDFLGWALFYAQQGWSVFPLRPLSKVPATPHGFKDATTDQAVITAWWTQTPNANIGIATGVSGALVVDVDTKAGKVGSKTYAALVSEFGEFPETFTVQTYSGGWHHYFLMPEPRLGNTTGTAKAGLGPDIDTRGDGGYVVAPPSVVEDTNPLASMFDVGPGAAERWEATEVTAQRAIAALLLSPEVLGQVRIRRMADSAKSAASDQVNDRIRWVTATAR